MLWQDEQQAVTDAGRASGPDLPTTFADTFSAQWSRNELFDQDMLGESDRLGALGDYLDQIKAKTGVDLGPKLDYGGQGATTPATMLLQQANDEVAKLNDQYPELQLAPLTNEQFEANAVDRRRQANEQFEATMARPRGPGATVGTVAGGFAAGFANPINLMALPIAPEESLGIVGSALRWGLIGAGAQVAQEAVSAPFQEEVEPGYLESGQPIANVGEAFLGAAAVGGGVKGLGNLWTRLRTGAWPTSVRDAGNAVESEANLSGSNVYPGFQGEVAHRQALSTAIDAVLGNNPVDVSHIITPDIEAASRGIMMRLEGERGVALPIFDERAIRLTAEEAQLREQHATLGQQIAGLPEGDLVAADRLNRLQAVERQLSEPEESAVNAAARRALENRRDQILVNTTPESLQEAAAPIAQRRVLGAQQGQIARRLAEIGTERNRIEAENLGRTTALGQTMPVHGLEDAVGIAMRRPIVETPMSSGANSSRDLNGPVYVDPRVPQELRRPVAVHETVEQVMMQRGLPYEQAHLIATQAEKRAVEAAGMNWEEYTHKWDGLLDATEHEKVSNLPPDLHVNPEEAIGHHRSASKQARGVPIMQARALAARLAEEARQAGRATTEIQPQLPFERTAAEVKAAGANEALAAGVRQIARRAGYEMPEEEAAKVAEKLVAASPADADDLLRALQISPRQVAEYPLNPRLDPRPAGPPQFTPAEQVVGSPEFAKATRMDIDRERATGDINLPHMTGPGENEVGYRSLDDQMANDVDALNEAAAQLESCAAGGQTEEAEAA